MLFCRHKAMGLAIFLNLFSVSNAQSLDVTPGVQFVGAIIQRGPDNQIKGRFAPGGALFLDFKLQGPHALRVRADALVGPVFQQGSVERRLTTWGLGADYLFYPSGRSGDGLYILLGARSSRYRDEIRTAQARSSLVKNTVGAAAGFGYTFFLMTDLGVRWTRERVEEINLDSLQFVAGLRF